MRAGRMAATRLVRGVAEVGCAAAGRRMERLDGLEIEFADDRLEVLAKPGKAG